MARDRPRFQEEGRILNRLLIKEAIMNAISRQHEITFLLASKLRKIGFYQRWKVAFNTLLLVAQLIVKLII